MEPVRSAAVTSYLAVPDVDAGAVDVTVYADGVTETDRVEIWLREGGVGYNVDNPGKTSTVWKAGGTASCSTDSTSIPGRRSMPTSTG